VARKNFKIGLTMVRTLIDSHCHVDLYPYPSDIAADAERDKVVTLVVTNLPSAFEKALPFIRNMKYIRLALGLHPLTVEKHDEMEKEKFVRFVSKTSYIGEVGLDFSPSYISTKGEQIKSFRFVLECLKEKQKFITLHSRKAESTVLDILEEYKRPPLVFHWYSGSLKHLERAIEQGHFFSFNPSMIRTAKGKKIIERVPPERVLTETDGPFVKIGKRSAIPQDVAIVENYLCTAWSTSISEVKKRIKTNFFALLPQGQSLI